MLNGWKPMLVSTQTAYKFPGNVYTTVMLEMLSGKARFAAGRASAADITRQAKI